MKLRGLLAVARTFTPAWSDRRNVMALAARLNVPLSDAAWIYRRSRAVGFGAAMRAYEERRTSERRGSGKAPQVGDGAAEVGGSGGAPPAQDTTGPTGGAEAGL